MLMQALDAVTSRAGGEQVRDEKLKRGPIMHAIFNLWQATCYRTFLCPPLIAHAYSYIAQLRMIRVAKPQLLL